MIKHRRSIGAITVVALLAILALSYTSSGSLSPVAKPVGVDGGLPVSGVPNDVTATGPGTRKLGVPAQIAPTYNQSMGIVSRPPVAGSDPTVADQSLIKTGTIEIEVADVDASATRARTLIVGLGGLVSDSSRSGGDHPVMTVTYRVPAARFDDALDGLRGLGSKIVAEQTQTIDVTAQVVDLGARLVNLRASEKALQSIMDRTVKIDEVLAVQTQLTDVRGQIEQLTAQQQTLAQQSAYGTISATYEMPAPAAVTAVSQGWDPAAIFDRAQASLIAITQHILGVGIYVLVVGLPIGLALLILGVPAVLITRRLRRHARPAEPLTPPTG
jgi:hypothetical protein